MTIGTAGLGCAALALATTLAIAPAAQADPKQPVPEGIDPATIPGAVVFGNTDPNTPETVTFVLKERNAGQLEAEVTHGTHHFLSVAQFRRLYGQSDRTVHALENYLAGFGIATQSLADNVDVTATGTAGEFDQALAVTQKNFRTARVPATVGHRAQPAQRFHGPTGVPELPRSIGRSVAAVLGLTTYSPYVSSLVSGAKVNGVTAPKDTVTFNGDCVALTGLESGCHVPADFASTYHLDPLYKQADGAGQTIAIVTLAALDPGAPEEYWSDIAHLPNAGRTVTVTNIDGGPGAPNDTAGTGETDLDVEQSGGLAPGADVDVYQAPNTDAGFADAFFQAASDNLAGSVSTSWGESETDVQAAVAAGQETAAYETAFDEAFLELAIQGQSAFDAAGDAGAYDASRDLGTTDPSVDISVSSAYITSAGGTTLPFSHVFGADVGLSLPVTVAAERAWGWDYLWPVEAAENDTTIQAVAPSFVVGGGGGFSTETRTPSYQLGVPGTNLFSQVKYLTPTAPQEVAPGLVEPTDWTVDPTPPVTPGFAAGHRAVPDLSADADPETGYLLFEPSAVQNDGAPLQGGWGGTSFVAPQLAGASAVIDSVNHGRAGLWNPALYRNATSRSSALHPLNDPSTDNDNILFTGTPGTVFNPATGLGTPDLARLAFALR